jgi:anti-sigma B factor antagonist
MKIQSEIVHDVAVIIIKGELKGTPETDDFRSEIQKHLDNGLLKIVIDFRSLTWINSLGLGSLIGSYKTVRNNGGVIVIINASEKIKNILTITQLIKIFRLFDSLDDALTSLHEG